MPYLPAPPVAKTVARTIVSHGEERNDPYFWLRDRTDPDVVGYLEAENQYADAVMADTAELQERLYKEILGRIQETDLSVPVRKGDYYYYTRTEQGKEYPVHCRRKGSLTAPEEVLIDGNVLAEGVQYFRLGNFSVSPNQKLLAYSTENAGDETYTIYVKDLESGALLPDRIENTYYGLSWAADNKTFFYLTLDEAKRPYRLHRHRLGRLASDDEVVYQEDDEKFILGVHTSRDEELILLTAASHTTSEVHYLDANEPEGSLQVIAPRQAMVEYYVEPQGPFLFIRTNEQAPNFRLMRTLRREPARAQWEEVIPHRTDVLLEGADGFAEHLVLEERHAGLMKLRIFDAASDREGLAAGHYIEFPEPTYAAGPGANPEYETRMLRFHYTSLITPNSVFDYDMETRERELKKQTPVLGGYNPEEYQSERITATAADGVAVPMSLVYRKDTPRDGSAPGFLYAYGSYGYSIDASFSSARLSLLDRGFVYAIAHIRGGEDLGKVWHDHGKLLHKKNTFTDFIACAEHLIAQKYVAKDQLVINGGSAGGLLMGAVVNMRPDLFAACLAAVPFVDVLNTMEDPSLPLTIGEYEEWGNPAEQNYFEYIRSYAPYENVAAQGYPHLFVRAGLNDPRVSYWEPAKWVAKLRVAKTDERLLLLKTEMGAGHGGPSGRYEALRETAFDYAFFLKALGRGESQPPVDSMETRNHR